MTRESLQTPTSPHRDGSKRSPSSKQPAKQGGLSLAWLISPVSNGVFFQEHWEKLPLVVQREQPRYFTSLLSLDDVDRVITTLDRRYPDVTLKNAARPVSADHYSGPGGVLDVAKVYQLFQEGSTITLAYVDTLLPPLTLLCRSLEKEFSCPFQTNVYLTPPGAQGAKPHYDTHDVFVLQIAGSKKWTIFGTPVELPLPAQDFDPAIHELGATTLEFELQPGDLAYVPRGVAHEAKSTDTISLHITTGVLRYTWADLLLECIAGASLNDAGFRKALPPGFAESDFDRSKARRTLMELLQRAATDANFDAAFDYFIDKFIAACPPVLDGQFGQLAMLERLTVESRVGARPGVIARFEMNGNSESVDCYGRKISFPPPARDAVRFALSHSSFSVKDLPGRLDEAGKLTVVRRLIREGLLMALES